MTLIQEFRAKLEDIILDKSSNIYEGLSPDAEFKLMYTYVSVDGIDVFSFIKDWRVRKLTKAIRSCVVTGE